MRLMVAGRAGVASSRLLRADAAGLCSCRDALGRRRLVVRWVAEWEHPVPGLGGEHQRVAVTCRAVVQNAFADIGFTHLGDALFER